MLYVRERSTTAPLGRYRLRRPGADLDHLLEKGVLPRELLRWISNHPKYLIVGDAGARGGLERLTNMGRLCRRAYLTNYQAALRSSVSNTSRASVSDKIDRAVPEKRG